MSNHSRRLARWSAFGAAMLAAAGGLTAASARQTSATQTAQAGLAARAGDPSHCYFRLTADFIGSAYVAGYANATKEKESVLIGPGPDNQPRAGFEGLDSPYALADLCPGKHYGDYYQYVAGVPVYHGLPELPPARITVLDFGFMPATATIELSYVRLPDGCKDIQGHQILPGPVYTCLIAYNPASQDQQNYTVTATALVQARVLSLSANGASLRVGPGCKTAVPFPLVLTANGKNHYNVTSGGLLTGEVTITRFTGCGVSENLDPIVDAAISGSRNLAKITQGPTCVKFIDPPHPPTPNCRSGPGPGHPWGIPKYFPIPPLR